LFLLTWRVFCPDFSVNSSIAPLLLDKGGGNKDVVDVDGGGAGGDEGETETDE